MRTFSPIAALAAILILLGGVGLSSCAKDKSDGAKGQSISPPEDQATPDERLTLDAGVAEIEGIMADLGSPRTFRTLPLVLTRDDHHTFTDRPAACVSLGGKPQFIIVKRSVLHAETQMRALRSETTLYRVLLHEIGHCYFGRDHDDAQVASNSDRQIKVSFQMNEAPHDSFYKSVDASVMHSNTLRMPIALKRYYAAELLGQERAAQLSDLAKYATFEYY